MKALSASCITLLSLCCMWYLIVLFFQLPPYILPSPMQVLFALQKNAALIFFESKTTILETILGLLLGVWAGSFAAIGMVLMRPLRFWLFPLLIASQALPVFAIAPLLVVWFGYGMTSKIVTTMLMIFFPVTSAFFDGLKQTPLGWKNLAATMNAKKSRYFWHIQLPAALPQLASGVRVATAVAPIGAIVGEWVGASHGLGYLIMNANANLQIDLMFAGLFVLVIFSLLLFFSVDKLLCYFIWWEK
ncbi:MAG: ABC transporter permease [Gammaproteobacteria bacterium]|nr:ABC transporter permease [Gammaproteobacteria bacterium]